MKQLTLLGVLATAIIGASAIAGAVRANEMAEKTAKEVQASAAATEAKAPAELKQISAEELQVLIDTNPALVIVDARRADAHAQGHIPGAVAVTPDEATSERLAELAPAKDTPMVFYCGNVQCPASAKAAHRAAEQGYTTLYKYSGGIDDWKSKGLPIVTAQADTQ